MAVSSIDQVAADVDARLTHARNRRIAREETCGEELRGRIVTVVASTLSDPAFGAIRKADLAAPPGAPRAGESHGQGEGKDEDEAERRSDNPEA